MTTAASTGQLAKTGAVVGVVAAASTTAVAVIAKASDVSLEVDGKAIPLAAFAWWTLVGTVVGVILVRVLRERRRFVIFAVVATALSLIPAIVLPDDGATKCVLVAAHLLAAVVVIPALSRLAADTR